MTQLTKVYNSFKQRNYSLMTAILFWCGLVVVSSLYITIPLVSIFADIFKVPTSQAAWTSSAFSFFYAVSFLFFGSLSDRYGRKQIIIMGLIALTLITPVLGLFNSLSALIVLRSLQGIAAAAFSPAALSYVVEIFPSDKRVTTIGFVSTGFLMSGIVGQIFSSLISQHFSWQSVFYFLGIIYLITTVLVALCIPKDYSENKDGDLLAPFKQICTVIKNKMLILCYMISITLLLAFVGMYTALGNYLTTHFRLDSQQILYIRSAGIIGMFLSPLAGKLVAKFGSIHVLRSGLALAVLGLSTLGISTNLPFLVVMTILFVGGISITIPTLISLVSQLGGENRGVVVSLYTFILFIGATLGPIITISLLKTGSYLVTFEMLALFLGMGFLISLIIRKRGGILWIS